MYDDDVVIRTPDQRLRVFVSSTLRELADERRAVRAAIERLHLAPVMFELGARPHPPRELYRSYLAQSDVFVGIYGDSYGWVAPDERSPGSRTSTTSPRVHAETHLHQDSRTTVTIASTSSSTASAPTTPPPTCLSTTADELEEQVAGDLATLLAERFDESRDSAETPDGGGRPDSPRGCPSAYIAHHRPGARDRRGPGPARQRQHAWSRLIGPGGIGKSRLAIEIALAARRSCSPTAPSSSRSRTCSNRALLLPTIAYRLGIRDDGEAALEERSWHALAGRRMLHRPRQLRADRRRGARDRPAVHGRADCDLPGDEPDRAAHPRRAGLRGAAAGDGGCPVRLGDARARPQSAAVELFVDRAHGREARLRAHRGQRGARRGICRLSKGCRSRSSWRPRRCGSHAGRHRGAPRAQPAAADRRRRGICPSVIARCARRSNGASAARASERELLEDLGVFAARFTLEAVEAIGAGRSGRARRSTASRRSSTGRS